MHETFGGFTTAVVPVAVQCNREGTNCLRGYGYWQKVQVLSGDFPLVAEAFSASELALRGPAATEEPWVWTHPHCHQHKTMYC